MHSWSRVHQLVLLAFAALFAVNGAIFMKHTPVHRLLNYHFARNRPLAHVGLDFACRADTVLGTPRPALLVTALNIFVYNRGVIGAADDTALFRFDHRHRMVRLGLALACLENGLTAA